MFFQSKWITSNRFQKQISMLISSHIMSVSGFLWVANTSSRDDVGCFALRAIYERSQSSVPHYILVLGTKKQGLTRRVLYLSNPLITPSLTQQHPCGRRMSQNMSTNRLSPIRTSKERISTRIRLDLIGLSFNQHPFNSKKYELPTMRTQTLNSSAICVNLLKN